MTTSTTSGPMLHTSDASFRAWATLLSTGFDTVSIFPKTSDTGQINLLTALKPAVGGSEYEIRRLNDSLNATSPLVAKIEYGTSPSALVHPGLWITVGTGSNGSGTITGIAIPRILLVPFTALAVGNFPSYVCGLEGYIACAVARGALTAVNGCMFFALTRWCDINGTPIAGGANLYFSNNGGIVNRITANTLTLTNTADLTATGAMFPGGNTSTLIGVNVYTARHFTIQPTGIFVVPQVLTYMDLEIGNESVFSLIPVGATSRTYLTLGSAGNGPTNASMNNISTHRLAIQFE